jgi:hypothetical protein
LRLDTRAKGGQKVARPVGVGPEYIIGIHLGHPHEGVQSERPHQYPVTGNNSSQCSWEERIIPSEGPLRGQIQGTS